MANDSVSYSWFCVFNNPHEHGYPFENVENPTELLKRDENSFKSQVRKLLEKLKNEWVGEESPSTTRTRTGAWSYCISADGLHHIHMVIEDTVAMRFSKIKSSYCQGMHFVPTKGNKKQADDYINKRGEFAEKGEQVVDIIYHGEIHSNQGHRSDLDDIQELIDNGTHPNEIISMSLKYARFQKFIISYYNAKKSKEVPVVRNIKVHWLFGGTGCGKSREYINLCDKYGENEVCRITNYDSKYLFDSYNCESVVFFDDFRGYNWQHFLNFIDVYKINDLPSRYHCKTSCYNEVYITSPLLPHEVFNYQYEKGGHDGIEQLMRRITDITYYYKNQGKYYKQTINVVGTEVHQRGEFSNIPDDKYLNCNNNDNDNDISSTIGNLDDYVQIC